MINLYVLYDVVQDKLIAEMETPIDAPMMLGAVNPATDGNFYKRLLVAGVEKQSGGIMGLEKWWEWACERDHVEISDEFSFDIKNIKIKCITIK